MATSAKNSCFFFPPVSVILVWICVRVGMDIGMNIGMDIGMYIGMDIGMKHHFFGAREGGDLIHELYHFVRVLIRKAG